MKNIFSVLIAMSLALAVCGQNAARVWGTVKFDNGDPAPGYMIHISPGTGSLAQCVLQTPVQTNANGLYQQSIRCDVPLRFVVVSLKNCNEMVLSQTLMMNNTAELKADFVVCRRVECQAKMIWRPLPPANISGLTGYAVMFTSALTRLMPGDEIKERIWRFGDGTVMRATTDSVRHVYKQPGTYEACLTIVTRQGCESKICERVVIAPRIKCEARFRFEIHDKGKVVFTSLPSVIAASDEIIARRWDFGNGASQGGNDLRAEVQYDRPGRYNVCLQIKTRSGCESRFCQVVELKPWEPAPDSEGLRIVRLFPNPVNTQMTVAINNPKQANVRAGFTIANAAGNVLWTNRISSPPGMSTHTIQTGFLRPGAYKLNLISEDGVHSVSFYKVN